MTRRLWLSELNDVCMLLIDAGREDVAARLRDAEAQTDRGRCTIDVPACGALDNVLLCHRGILVTTQRPRRAAAGTVAS